MKKALWVLAFCVASVVASSAAHATQSSTDASDLWWNPNESGWGMQVVQTGTVIVVTMFVYDEARNPAWYTATANNPGGLVWSGDLYKTNGPWFGMTPFDPATVAPAKVGTLTFAAGPTVISATVTYTIDGVTVTKDVQRQTLTFDCFCGEYVGMIREVLTCDDSARNGTFNAPSAITIYHNSAAPFVMTSTEQGRSCSYSGTYAQYGRFGQVTDGAYSCTDGTSGAFQFAEMYVNTTGFTGRGTLRSQGCTATFSFGGIRK
ncbi:MAG TPA: hypothetical protein VFZ14_12250 [Burkholderiales bacterium]|nr:hypothetical protein [Burkholderiales bacterium]